MRLNLHAASMARRICVYGAPKSGKTKLAGDLATTFKLLWLDLENGAGTLKQLPEDVQANIEYVNIPDSKNYPIAIETVIKIFNGRPVQVCDEHGKVACPKCKLSGGTVVDIDLSKLGPDWVVVLDSATQLTNSAVNFLAKDQPDDYKPDWEDYRRQGALLDKVFSNMQQAKYHCVVISHEAMVEMEDKAMRIVPVCGTNNFSRNFAKFFDDVVICQVVGGRHILGSSTTYKPGVIAGSRTGRALKTFSLLPLFEQADEAEVISVVAPAQPTKPKFGLPGKFAIGAKPTAVAPKEVTEAKDAIVEPADTVKVTPESSPAEVVETAVVTIAQAPVASAQEQATPPEPQTTGECVLVTTKSGEQASVALVGPDGKPRTAVQMALAKQKAMSAVFVAGKVY